MLWRCKMAKKRRRRRPNEYGELYSKYYFCTQPSFLEIRLGYALIPLVDKECGAELLEEITKVRNKIDAEYGITIPKISIHDDMNNEPYEYAIYLYGNRICSGEIRMGYTMCLNLGAVEPSDKEVKADKAIDPVYGNAGYWIPADTPEEKELENLGYVLVEPAGIIREHLEKIIKENTTKVLNQSLVNLLINKVRPSNPDVIDDIFFNHQFPTSSMKRGLNLLLSEKYSIRDMNTILETIADNISQSQNLEFLVEKIKEQLPEPVVEKD